MTTPQSVPKKRRIGVIGGGIIGLFTAHELLDRGFEVDLIDPDPPGGRQAASFGNGTWVNEGSLIPICLPGLWRAVPGFLLDPNGPFVIRWSQLPRLLPWLVRFMLAGRSWSRIARDLPARFALLKGTVAQYERRAEAAGIADLIGARTVMYVYRTEAEFEADAKNWALRRSFGVDIEIHRGESLRALAPELSADYAIGARIMQAASLRDPGALCAGLAEHFKARGGAVHPARATGFRQSGKRLQAIVTDQGEIPCDGAVMAAGVQARALAAMVGDRVPMIAERGYHITIKDASVRPKISLMPADGKMAVASTRAGLRLAGQVELAAPDSPPDWSRSKIQLGFAKRMFPQAAKEIEDGPHDLWMGSRPSTPDCLPVIAPATGCADVVHAFGHGHTGMAMAPATARLVADLIEGVTPFTDPHPYAPARFRRVT